MSTKFSKRGNELSALVKPHGGTKPNNDHSIIIIKTLLLVLASHWVPNGNLDISFVEYSYQKLAPARTHHSIYFVTF